MGWKRKAVISSWEQNGTCRCLRFLPEHSCAGALHCANTSWGCTLSPQSCAERGRNGWAEQNPAAPRQARCRLSGPTSSLVGLSLSPSWGKEWWLKKLVLTILGVTVLAPFNADLASNLAFSPGLRALMSLNSHYPTGLLSRLVFKQATKLLEVSPPSQLFQPGNNAEHLFMFYSASGQNNLCSYVFF